MVWGNLVGIHTRQTIFDAWQVEESTDFECLMSCGRSGVGVLFPSVNELIFGKTGFCVIWRLLKKL